MGPSSVGPASVGPQGLAGLAVVALALAIRPWLWPVAVVQLFALAPRGWWRRRPFLPVPDPDYLAFRLQTMYGDTTHQPEPGDVVTYLEWCRSYRRLSR